MAHFRRSNALLSAATPETGSGRLPEAIRRVAKRLRVPLLCAASAALLLAGRALPARAEVSLLLEQPYGGLGVVNPTGHAALYFDHICAATPIELRPCRPGELGAVISRYDGIDHRDWVAIPLVAYLYAVESPADIPTTMNRAEEVRLRDQYRRRELESVAPDLPDGGTPGGNWYELVGSAYDRAIYGFSVATTAEQDASLMAMFNDRRNVERYNGAFRNCADFARTTINHIYPHAIRRNFIADFGLTTPKQVARGLSHYAHKHPGVDFHVFRVPQVPGSIWRSYGIQGVTESLIKRYGVPLVVLSPVATGVVFVAYLGHGRFDMPRDAPVLDLRQRALNVDTTTTAEAATQAAPAMLPLPTPDGIAMRSGPPSDLFAPGAPAAALEAPGQPASEQSPPALLAYPTYE